jgi:conjugal transfer pilus assembly protein TraW
MSKLLSYWQELLFAVVLFVAFAEIGLRALRIGRFHPEIKHCRWSYVPRITWLAMTENKFHLFELLARMNRRHPKGIDAHPKGPLVSVMILTLSLCAIAARVGAQSLTPVAPPERFGPVWPIVETDIRNTIHERLQARLPELTARLKNSLATYRAPATERPTTDTARTLHIDPTITLGADLVSHDGRVLAASGQRINPLSVLPLRRTYLIVNGADQRQVSWAKRQLDAHKNLNITLLLNDGSLEGARQALPKGTRIFPAPPALFARFSIDSVPARLSRHKDTIRIDLVAEAELDPDPTLN